MRARLALAAGASLAGLALLPSAARAHGLVGRTDLPIPDWLFVWGAAAVLIASFVALAVLWPKPRLQEHELAPLPVGVSRVLTSAIVEWILGAVGVALLLAVVVSGLAGIDVTDLNLAPTFVYVAFWLGLVPVSVLFGDVFGAVNPWRAVGRLIGASVQRISRSEPLAYPGWLGYWPAAAGLFGFACLELVLEAGDDPSTVAIATVVYSAITFLGMALFGVERWCERGEAFGVYFGLLARLSIFERRDRQIAVRRLLSGVPGFKALPGTVVLLAVMIGSVSFDGFSSGGTGQSLVFKVNGAFRDLGWKAQTSLEVTFGLGLLVTVVVMLGFYWLGMAGARTVGGQRSTLELARGFAHTLVPIALAYVAAHYVSLLMFQGQAIAPLASDPLGEGWNLFGTAAWTIDYGLLGAQTFWYLQVGFVIAGHVAALVLAHDRALVVFPDPRQAVRSQYWLLGVMVGFTSLALWLLSQARGG